VGAVKRYHRQSVTEGSVESAGASLVRDKHTEGTSLRERGGGGCAKYKYNMSIPIRLSSVREKLVV
jgi:hypothetical protein